MLKYIRIIGASSAGKSTTMQAVAESLGPQEIRQLIPDTENHLNSILNLVTVNDIFNGTYILSVSGKTIVIVSGSPSEQGIRITILIEIIVKLKIKIDFLLVASRTFETKSDSQNTAFDTNNELKAIGECIYEERIYKIEDYKTNIEWKNRIENIVKKVKENI